MFVRLYWILPLVSAVVWIGMLISMIAYWCAIGRPIYPSMDPGQTIAFISDVGAEKLKPLFIAGSAVMVVCLDAGMIAERWLRHKGKLAPNTSWWQKGLDILAIIAALAGGSGIIALSIEDTLHHPSLHDKLLVLFIVGYVISAIFICAEYQRLGIHFREHRVLRASFWLKLVFILVEVALAIPFGIFNTTGKHVNDGAILEWTVAFVFTLYILTFLMDLFPAARTKNHYSRETVTEMGQAEDSYDSSYYVNGSGRNAGHSEPLPASSNF